MCNVGVCVGSCVTEGAHMLKLASVLVAVCPECH